MRQLSAEKKARENGGRHLETVQTKPETNGRPLSPPPPPSQCQQEQCVAAAPCVAELRLTEEERPEVAPPPAEEAAKDESPTMADNTSCDKVAVEATS